MMTHSSGVTTNSAWSWSAEPGEDLKTKEAQVIAKTPFLKSLVVTSVANSIHADLSSLLNTNKFN